MRFLVLTPLFFLLFSCSTKVDSIESASEINSFDDISIDYAVNFDLIPTDDGYNLLILSPENGEIEQSHFIKTLTKPKLISLTSTFNGMLCAINSQNYLSGVSSEKYVYDSLILQKIASNEIQVFGDESNHSLEKIIANQSNIVFYNGFGDGFPNEEKLNQLGVSTIPIYDWRENHPLGKAEWIKLAGVITGKIDEANKLFQSIVLEYNRLQTIVDSVSSNPTVTAGSFYGDVWYAPGGESYFATLLKDAGANYQYKESKGTASLELSLEQVLDDNIEIEYWINPTVDTKTKVLQMNPQLKHLSAFENGMFCYSGQMTKFWEQSAIMPHLLLHDLIQVLHPELSLKRELYFYKNIQ